MKSIILRIGLLMGLILMGWSHREVSAEANMSWTAKCSSYGTVKLNQNPPPQQTNCLLTNAALSANVPPEVVKAVAAKESDWRQFDSNGQPFKSADGGIGIMQITNQSGYDQQRLANDITYNIEAGVEILSSMFNRTDLPKIKNAGRDVIENWYFPVMAYNGTKPVNSPLHQADGSENLNAYQESVIALLEEDSFLGDTNLAQFPFTKSDFIYDPASDENITFNKLIYSLPGQMHATGYAFKTGDKVIVTQAGVSLRSKPSSSSAALKILGKNTVLTINGNFVYDQSSSNPNRFVWYPVKTADSKTGFISSAYITKLLDFPIVNPVGDHDTTLSGRKASAYAVIKIMNGTKQIGTATASANGYFKANIPKQKAGTRLSISYKSILNVYSPASAVIVLDKTAPSAPRVNAVPHQSRIVTGKTEAFATVIVSISGKTYTSKADHNGNFKVSIPSQKKGVTISVKAKDSAGNVSAARKIIVS